MMLYSYCKPLNAVKLPIPRDRQFYMHTFDLDDPSVPMGFEDYLEPVRALVRASGAKGKAHLTIDEKVVKAGMSQRRPKPHVDGCFTRLGNQAVWSHGGSSGWLHYCNNIPTTTLQRMPVIVAASVPGCKVWPGIFEGEPASDGDLSHISNQFGDSKILPANMGYILSPDCVHESMVFDKDTPRTFLRIALEDRKALWRLP